MYRILLSLRLLRVEAIVTTMIISMPIMNPFYASIGMDQGEIGLNQAAFTLAVLVVNIPTGWLADRFSRKLSNAGGNLVTAIGFLGYAAVQNLGQVILCEVVIGVGMAFTQGADIALLRGYCTTVQQPMTRQLAIIGIGSPIAQAVAAIGGGVIGANNPRLALALTAVPFFIGAAISLVISESGERLRQVHRNPFRDMVRATHGPLAHSPRLRWLIVASAISREITHPIIWVLTPLLVLAGVPVAIIGIGWALNLGATSLGSWLAGHYGQRCSETERFMVPMAAALVALATLSIQVSALTIGLYATFGLVRGWTATVMPAMVQAHTPECASATISSISGSVSQLLYIPLVWGINAAGVNNPQQGLLCMLVVFGPLVLLTGYRLSMSERR
jgi:MFS family permease